MPRRSALLLAVTLLPLSALAARAQTLPPQDQDLGEIIVTGAPYGVTRRATTLSIEVLDEEALRSAPAATLGDVLNGLPGVRSSSFSAGASRPVIRGLAGPRVLVLSNGVGLIDASGLSPDHQVAADPADATRIEVLRGPSTLAYGGTAIGGVVNVIDDRVASQRPANGVAGRIGGQLTSVDDGWASSAGLSAAAGPIVFTLEGQRREAGDYRIPRRAESRRLLQSEGGPVETLQGGDLENSFSNVSVYGGGLSWVGTDGFVGFSVRRARSDYGVPGHAHLDETQSPDEQEAENARVTIGLKQTRFDLRGEWGLDLGPFERVRFSSGFADYEHTEFEGQDVGTRFLSDGWEGRLELVQAARGGWRGAVGGQALHRNFDAVGDEAYVPNTRISEAGAFIVQRLDLDRFGLEGGVRFDHRDLDSRVGERHFENLSASVGLFYRPNTDWFLGLSLARNGRAPTEAELFADGPHAATRAYEVGDPDLESEHVTSVEATIHFDRGPLTVDLHLFRARYDGFIDLAATGLEHDHLPVLAYVQTGADFHGLETEASWRLLATGSRRSLTLAVAGDWVRGSTDLGPPARIPPWSVTARAEMEVDAWSGRLEVRRIGAQDRIAALELPTEGYTTVNLFGSWSPDPDGGVRLYGEARNLNDAEIREHASFLKDLAPSPGRNFRFGVAYRF